MRKTTHYVCLQIFEILMKPGTDHPLGNFENGCGELGTLNTSKIHEKFLIVYRIVQLN